jgi:predicted secreted hydrolase
LSRKGPNAGQASYYYSVPQLKTTGTLKLKDKSYTVSGVSWMDHEFGSNQLSKDQRGWEWFAIQFDDGAALMLYLLRNADGSTEPNSSGTWIDASGHAEYLPLKSIGATPSRIWTSPHSQQKFPLEWRIELPDRKVVLDIKPAQDDQEVRSSNAGIGYYEGDIHVSGTINGKPVTARGYLEITGAADGLGGKL